MQKAVLLAGLVICALTGTWLLHKAPGVQIAGDLASHGDRSLRRVALTFDDGPSSKHTGAVLDKLDALGVRATFFLNGSAMEKHPAVTRLIVERGHELGNHSYSHERMLFRSQSWIAEEVESTDALIRKAGHSGEIYFRPPYGKRLLTLPIYLATTNRTTITWDVNGDPNPSEDSASDISNNILKNVRPGSIILLHVMWNSRQNSRDALESIVVGLRDAGYDIVTVSQLLNS